MHFPFVSSIIKGTSTVESYVYVACANFYIFYNIRYKILLEEALGAVFGQDAVILFF